MKKDPVFVLLVINALLVVLGYAITIYTAGDLLAIIQWIKLVVLFFSVLYLIKLPYLFLRFTFNKFYSYALLGLFLMFTAIYAEEPIHSIVRSATFFIPLIYICISLAYLVTTYSYEQVLHHLLIAINSVYSIPVLCFLLFARTDSYLNIYYLSPDPYTVFGYASNQYGWAGCMVLVTGMDLLRNLKIPRWYKWFLFMMCIISFYLILASGNRASWLVLIIGLMSFIVFHRRISLYRKIVLILFTLGAGWGMSNIPDSSLTVRLEKTYRQLEEGESRWVRTAKAIEYANTNLLVWVGGWGMFSPPAELKKNMHNSYFEVLFGAGMPAFCFFLWQFLIQPCLNFFRYFSERYLFLFPVVIIPYFESNLTGGQFLYFPWFVLILMVGKLAVGKSNLIDLNKQRHGKFPRPV